MIPDLQRGDDDRSGVLIGFDPDFVDDVPLYWQQWKLSSPVLRRISEVVTRRAHEVLHQPSS